MEMNMKADAYIPDFYIDDSKQKIEMYKRFRGLETLEDMHDLQSEMMDRFGAYPVEVEKLFILSNIRLRAEASGVESISQEANKTVILVGEKASSEADGASLFGLVNELGRHIGIGTSGKKIQISVQHQRLEEMKILTSVQAVVKGVQEAKKEPEETTSPK